MEIAADTCNRIDDLISRISECDYTCNIIDRISSRTDAISLHPSCDVDFATDKKDMGNL